MDSSRLRMLSGAEIVAKGRHVTDTPLPEVGTKEVSPNGSWLEKKQIQSALEARKALVAVERIDKIGCLSHAEWIDEQRLAEVTQQVGGYWQYLGHQVNGTFYLLPEEALYLMETNCLLLKHNNVTVSLQKAYSLLLDDKMTLTQYKVYASLSRVGYKVFRHNILMKYPKPSPTEGPKVSPLESNTVDANIDLSTNNNDKETPGKNQDDIIMLPDCNSALKTSLESSGIESLAVTDITMSMDEIHGPAALPNESPALPLNQMVSIIPGDVSPTEPTDASLASMTNKDVSMTASLSRVGYEVFGHNILIKYPKPSPTEGPKVSPLESNTVDANIDLSTNNNVIETPGKNQDDIIMLPDCNSALKTSLESSVIESLAVTDITMSMDEIHGPAALPNESPALPLNQMVSIIPGDVSPTEPTDASLASMANKDVSMTASLSRVGYEVFGHNILIKYPKPSPTEGPKVSPLESNTVDANIDLSTNNNVIETPGKNQDDIIMLPDCNSALKTSLESSGIESLAVTDITRSMDEIHGPAALPNESPALPLNQMVSIIPGDVSPTEPTDASLASMANKDISMTADNSYLSSQTVFSVDENGVIRLGPVDKAVDIVMETDPCPDGNIATSIENEMEIDGDTSVNLESNKKDGKLNSYIVKKLKLQYRNVPPSDPMSIHEKFKAIPDFYKKQVVTVNVPSEEYLPRNIYLNNTFYVINTNNVTDKQKGRCSTPNSRPSGNRALYKTIKNSIESENAAIPIPETPQFLPNTPLYEHPYEYFPNWRGRPHFQRFQRPFFAQPRFNQHPYFYRVMNSMPQNFTFIPRQPFSMNHRQRQKVKEDHLQAIKSLAQNMNNVSLNNYCDLKFSIKGLLSRFNKIYNENIILTPENNIVDKKQRIETIEIQDDEVEKVDKNQKLSNFDKYLASIKVLAARLGNLARKKQPISKQKRALCNLLKHFNKEYDAELHLGDDGEIIDKKLVVLDSSDSDVVATDEIETPKLKKRKSKDGSATINKKRKILANPFHVIAKINGSTSQSASDITKETSVGIEKYFDKNWLPSDDDFGKPMLCSKAEAQHLLNDSQQLYEFMDDPVSYKSWIDLKLTFYVHMEAIFSFENDLTESSNLTQQSVLKPILQGAILSDWTTSLEKLRIIRTNTDLEETSLKIDFDVYNRDVQNFRKTDPPKPHFRIICMSETSQYPSTAEVRALQSKLDDNVSIVFAVVGIASISYLQINPTDVPSVYIGND